MSHTIQSPNRVLLIEDDVCTGSVLRRIVRSIDPDLKVDWASSAEEARQLMRIRADSRQSYDLIVLDIYLAGKMTGLELWAELHASTPGLAVLLTSGMPVDEFLRSFGRSAICPPFLPKPFRIGECQQIILGLLGPPQRRLAS